MENITRFILNRSAAHVKRYHTTPMHAQESVAEHSHFVALVARILCYLISDAGYRVDALQATDMASIHDYEESVSGDIISSFKHSDPELTALIERLNRHAVEEVFSDLPEELSRQFIRLWESHGEGSIEGQVVLVADKLASLAFCREQMQMGNHYLEPIYQRYLAMIEALDYPWWLAIKERVVGPLHQG